MEETQEVKPKSFLEKIAPAVLVGIILFGLYFAYTKLAPNFNFGKALNIEKTAPVNQIVTKVDIDFLNSTEFSNLKHIADPVVFNKVQPGETILKGKTDPFAPVY